MENTAHNEPQNDFAGMTENSVRYGLQKIAHLIIEVEMLRREHQGLVDLAELLGQYLNEVLPHQTLQPADDTLYFKWSNQRSRYYALAKGVHEIWEDHTKYLSDVIEATTGDVERMPRPLPDDVQEQIEKITKYSKNFNSEKKN